MDAEDEQKKRKEPSSMENTNSKRKRTIMDTERDWANLMNDVLHCIYTWLPCNFQEYVGFRSVCRGWRTFASLSGPPPKFPWLLKCGNPWYLPRPESDLYFYPLFGGETSQIRNCQKYCGMVCFGPGHGYLLVCSEKVPYLLNPLTGNKIMLPELNASWWVQSLVCSGSGPIHNWYIVVYLLDYDGDFGPWACVIYHQETNSWKCVVIKKNVCSTSCHTCCFGGMIFATEDEHPTGLYDAVSGEKLHEVPTPEGENYQCTSSHLVESAGKILRVCQYTGGDSEVKDFIFKIYELCSEEGEGGKNYFWVKVPDIGNQILFLDAMNSFSLNAPPGINGNCIYFMTYKGENPCMYDIGTGTLQKVPCPFDRSTWFIPTLD